MSNMHSTVRDDILVSMSNLARPISRAFLADGAINCSPCQVYRAIEVLLINKLVMIVQPESRSKRATWYVLTANGHSSADRIERERESGSEATTGRPSVAMFMNMTTQRGSDCAPRK